MCFPRSIDEPNLFIHSNIIGTFNLLTALKIHWENLNPHRKERFRLLHISTDEVFGSLSLTELPFTEQSPYSPNSPYSASKISADNLALSYFNSFNTPVTIMLSLIHI